MGACGALMMAPDQIADWARKVRTGSNGSIQLNTWITDPDPGRDTAHEAEVRAFLSGWGPALQPAAATGPAQDFDAQCAAMLDAGPTVMSSIMGLYPPHVVEEMKARKIKWFATVTTVAEARMAQEAGADVVIAQGMEAGGHRGAFNAEDAASRLGGLFSLLPAVVDAVDVPVSASGGVGTLDHLVEGVTEGGASAVLAASIFHFGTYTIGQAKAHMAAAGIPVRLT